MTTTMLFDIMWTYKIVKSKFNAVAVHLQGQKGEIGVGLLGEKGEPGDSVPGKDGEKGTKGEPVSC